uniref:C3H1-type domain-containing protein n=1 Tax=Timema genevievae TaxID=629358 RepID=A0A7R9JS68_TIMGE|nr:unnamed protein product [Timema genevievae]
MGKIYYCDFCDRSFVDGHDARKKHLMGSMHLRLRKEHYDSLRAYVFYSDETTPFIYSLDAATILTEESAKVPCKRFRNTGECVFGGNCRYSHYSQEQLWELRQQVTEEAKQKALNKAKTSSEDEVPTLSSYLQKRSKALLKNKSKDNQGDKLATWELPPELQGRSDLPPSLQGFTIDDFADIEFESWG